MDGDAGPSNLNVTEVEWKTSSLTTDNDSEYDIDSSHATDEYIMSLQSLMAVCT